MSFSFRPHVHIQRPPPSVSSGDPSAVVIQLPRAIPFLLHPFFLFPVLEWGWRNFASGLLSEDVTVPVYTREDERLPSERLLRETGPHLCLDPIDSGHLTTNFE
ncbi:hypothetical protein AVEN_262280-1 [Araneus ventricosus]|uniref:Uncharacterized protein n=1 Tax=Araneus ventricosus TaxID=182803 RepID=A0A4Y2RU88_ARAVE|nr:hypothetical protein AVEN_205948-1 [Araneus ventricosus]GBN79434.1 hypothetical protein AVEN_262280-1 [Araneus ventricosus]